LWRKTRRWAKLLEVCPEGWLLTLFCHCHYICYHRCWHFWDSLIAFFYNVQENWATVPCFLWYMTQILYFTGYLEVVRNLFGLLSIPWKVESLGHWNLEMDNLEFIYGQLVYLFDLLCWCDNFFFLAQIYLIEIKGLHG